MSALVRRIRASMLPSYPDCGRRSAAKQWPEMIADAGYVLRKLFPSVGAAVGTAVHAAAAHVLRGKIETGTLAPIKDGVEMAMVAFREEIAPGAEWDPTTPNVQVAEYQVQRMAEAYLPKAEKARPLVVEQELRAEIAPGWELIGHLDLLEEPQHIDDLKTGALERPYQAQLGGYSLLGKSNGLTVKSAGISFIPRAKKNKPQPPLKPQVYDLDTAERAAFSTIHAIKRDVEAFLETGDPFAFAANPMSMMCTDKYCPAWGTKFCNLHMPKGNENGEFD